MTTNQAETIRRLNDAFRTTFRNGQVMMTRGVQALGPANLNAIIAKVQAFNTFTPGNDPEGEHDFGAFEHGGARLLWKIDYYTPDMEHGSEDPADPAQTLRVLTIMLAEEY